MGQKFVYLAGPILNTTNAEANDWRRDVDIRLGDSGEAIVAISPLRCEPLHGEKYTANYPDARFGTARAISSKNKYDIRACDLVLAYLPKPPPGRHQSFGTIIEIAWADMLGKPVIVVTDDPEVLEHPVINACAGWLLGTLDEGLEVVIGILGGYTGGKNV